MKPKQQALKKCDIVREIAIEAGITHKAAKIAVNGIYNILHRAVGEQKTFKIPEVGTVKGYLRPAKYFYNPMTKEKVWSDEKLMVKIIPRFRYKNQ